MSLRSEEEKQGRKNPRKNTTKLPIPSTLRSRWEEKEKLLSDSPLKMPASAGLGGGQHQNCEKQAKEAKEESVSGVSNAFIPECDELGDYNPVQCYKVSQWIYFFSHRE